MKSFKGWAVVLSLVVIGVACSTDRPKTITFTTQQDIDGAATGGNWEEVAASRHVQCTIADVEVGDLGSSSYDERVPRGRWTKIEGDRSNRCGDDFETLMWRLANCERERKRVQPLSCDLRLVWSARAHSRDMTDQGYFDHFSPNGESPFDRMEKRGMVFSRAGENIAFTPTMGIAHLGWMTSPDHRKNILNGEFTHGGVGVVRTEEGYFLTGLFLTPP
ncbi:MAG: CAP domain-containing protein [Bradymonadaceae bacterium]